MVPSLVGSCHLGLQPNLLGAYISLSGAPGVDTLFATNNHLCDIFSFFGHGIFNPHSYARQ